MASGEKEKAEEKRRATEDTAGTDEGRSKAKKDTPHPRVFADVGETKGLQENFVDVGEVKDLGVSVYVPFAEGAPLEDRGKLGKGETKELEEQWPFAGIALGKRVALLRWSFGGQASDEWRAAEEWTRE